VHNINHRIVRKIHYGPLPAPHQPTPEIFGGKKAAAAAALLKCRFA